MRIAVIAPVHPSEAGDVAASLVDALRHRGLDTDFFVLEENETDSTVRFSEIMREASGADVVHNFAGLPPLAFAPLIATPILTTLLAPTLNETLADLQAFGRYTRVAFAANEGVDIDGLPLIATVRHDFGDPGAATDRYLAIYRDLIDRSNREDHRPWGWYIVLTDEPDHKVKRFIVYPGKRISLQRHRHREEHWFIISGEALVVRGDTEFHLAAGDAIDIPRGMVHRIENTGTTPVMFIEIQTGAYFGEDDIERLHDDYGRAG